MQSDQQIPNKDVLIERLRNWDADYVERESERIKATGEVFTPTALVRELLENFSIDQFIDPTKTFLDPCCGNGQFLSEVLIKKLENGQEFENSLRHIYGVDIMLDNVKLCQDRLLCGLEQFRYIVENNIICADALSFNFDTWEPAPKNN